jgi:hypothetical protein
MTFEFHIHQPQNILIAYNDIRVESFQTLGICQALSLSCKVAINNFSCAFGEGKKAHGCWMDC